jgi:hypothetical protein
MPGLAANFKAKAGSGRTKMIVAALAAAASLILTAWLVRVVLLRWVGPTAAARAATTTPPGKAPAIAMTAPDKTNRAPEGTGQVGNPGAGRNRPGKPPEGGSTSGGTARGALSLAMISKPSDKRPDAEDTVRSGSLTPFESPADWPNEGRIDELVFQRLAQLGIEPARVCSDAVFVRRVYLDVIGTLPTAQQARDFLADRRPNKRPALVDRLLERREFADYWAMKWSDLLRVKAEFPINLWPNAARVYHHWIRASLRQNMPYDRFVREILTSSGSNFRVPQVNFYRALQSREPSAIAQAVALAFMGARAENWPKERLAGMAAFFSKIGYKSTGEWKEEIVLFDPDKPAARNASPAVFPDGTPARLSPNQDPREALADWLLRPGNPWFARQIVNRVWYWLLGRGIIHEPDDIRAGNPPQNPQLLNALAEELVRARYDLKHVYRLILNSKAYQLSSISRTTHPRGAANFACYPLRRLEAEVLIDALCQITGTTEKYSSQIPEPFTFIPEDLRSIALPDGSITSAFLEMFGRPPRDTGLESERNNRATAAQCLHLLNSSHVRRKIEQSPKIQALLRSGVRPREIADELYLMVLSRHPTADESQAISAYRLSGAAQGRGLVTDIVWALLNTTEFLYRH